MDSSRVSLPSSQAGSDPIGLTPLEIIDGWLALFSEFEIHHMSAREYAVHAVRDIRDAIAKAAEPVDAGRPVPPHGSGP